MLTTVYLFVLCVISSRFFLIIFSPQRVATFSLLADIYISLCIYMYLFLYQWTKKNLKLKTSNLYNFSNCLSITQSLNSVFEFIFCLYLQS